MPFEAPLEMLTDACGSVSFGWVDEGVYYARFARSLSGRLGVAFAERLASVVEDKGAIKYFGDARGVESYDLVARSAFIRLVTAQRARFTELNLLWWDGDDLGLACSRALGEPLYVTQDAIEFETRLCQAAPGAQGKLLGGVGLSGSKARWPLGR
jgi:hypothetical protein